MQALVHTRGQHILLMVLWGLTALNVAGSATASEDADTVESAGQSDEAATSEPSAREPVTQEKAAKSKSKKSHCGLYCLYTIMRISGKDVDFRDLVNPEYISSSEGSTASELAKAAEDYGFHATALRGLTRRELVNSTHPMILHVKSSLKKGKYNHYELFLGMEEGKAKIYDPPKPVRLVPFSELIPRWGGNALVVSAAPIDTGPLTAPARMRLAGFSAAAITFILIVHWIRRRWFDAFTAMPRSTRLGLAIVQCAGLLVTAVLVGMVYHFTADIGFLARDDATGPVQQAHAEGFIPKVSQREVDRMIDSGAAIIDARLSHDYEAGHLDGAISLPVNANDSEYNKVTADISKQAHIVVYCQSAGCPFAGKVTARLRSTGFSNISIYRGGWNDWVAKHGTDNAKELKS